jgi:hypothetical protein
MFQYLPSPVAKEILDSISSMNPWIVVKYDGVCCQRVSLCSECWMKMIMQETVRDTLQHKRGDYSCCRAGTPGRQ